jgi:hypothetical protein
VAVEQLVVLWERGPWIADDRSGGLEK